jgi:hypothetical protein
LALLFALQPALSTAAAAADPLSFDDPGMHFSAPAGWSRIDQEQLSQAAGDSGQDPPAAVFMYHQGRVDQRSITITIVPFDDTLDAFEVQHLSELHSGSDAAFVDQHVKTTLSNGMPAYQLRVNSGSDAGQFIRRFEYLVFDGQRGITVTYSGRQGDFDDKEALAALSTLYVVAYPKRHAE